MSNNLQIRDLSFKNSSGQEELFVPKTTTDAVIDETTSKNLTDILKNISGVEITDGTMPADSTKLWIDTSENSFTDVVEEAPLDSKQYVRENGDWVESKLTGGISDPSNSILYLETQTEYDSLVKLKVINYPNLSYIKELDKYVYLAPPVFYPYPKQFTVELTLEYIDSMVDLTLIDLTPSIPLLLFDSLSTIFEELIVNEIDMKDKIISFPRGSILMMAPEECKAGDTYDIKIKTSEPLAFNEGFITVLMGIDPRSEAIIPSLKVKHICVDDYMFENFLFDSNSPVGLTSCLWCFLININKPEVYFELTKPILKVEESISKNIPPIVDTIRLLLAANQITPDTLYIFNILKGKPEIYGNPADKIVIGERGPEFENPNTILSFYSFINLINEGMKSECQLTQDIIKIVEK